MRQILNRSFSSPRSPNGSTPAGWTRYDTTPTGFTWGSGVYRAAGGGPMPDKGDRCLLLGAQDSVKTDTLTLGAGDYTSFAQVVAGSAFADVSHLEAQYTVADQGSDPTHSFIKLVVSDGTTSVTHSVTLSTTTVLEVATLRVALSTLDRTKSWTIYVTLDRDASSGSGSYTVPRCYVGEVRARWSPYAVAPPKVLAYSDDVAPDATVTGTTADTGFAVANAVDRRLGKPYISASGTSAYLQLDLSASPPTIDTLAIAGCQFEDGDVVTITGGTASPPSNVTYLLPVNRQHSGFVQFAPVAYRYWRVTIANASARKFVIGEVCAGLARNLQRGCEWGPTHGKSYMSRVLETTYGQRYAYSLADRQSWRMNMEQLERADVGDLMQLWDDCKRGVYPMLMIPMPDSFECFYGTFDDDFSEVIRSMTTSGAGSLVFTEQARAVVTS